MSKKNHVYPYLPPGRIFKFVGEDNPFMREAQKMAAQSGCTRLRVGLVIVKDGEIIARSANGFMRASERPAVCKRAELGCPTGTGYEHCPNCGTYEGHAERMGLKDAVTRGVDTRGADVYMWGHWWCCKPCWDAMIAAGIKDVCLFEHSQDRWG